MSNAGTSAVWSLAFKVAGADAITREVAGIAGTLSGLNAKQLQFGQITAGVWDKYRTKLDGVRTRLTQLHDLQRTHAGWEQRLQQAQTNIASKRALGQQPSAAEAQAFKVAAQHVDILNKARERSTALHAKEAQMVNNIGMVRFAAGFGVVAAAAGAATVAYAKWIDGLDHALLSYARVEKSHAGMQRAWRESREMASRSLVSVEGGTEISNRTRSDTSLKGQGGAMAKSVGVLTKALGVGEQQAISAVAAVAHGSFAEMEKETGYTAERVVAILNSIGEKADFSTAEASMRSLSKALVASNGEAAKIAADSWAEAFKRLTLTVGTELGDLARKVEKVTGLNAALKSAVGIEQHVSLAPTRAADNEQKAAEYTATLQKQSDLVAQQQDKVLQLATAWGGVVGRLTGMSDAVAATADKLREITVMGTAFATRQNQITRAEERGKSLADKKDYAGAFSAYSEAAKGTLGELEEEKRRKEQLTGFRNIGGEEVWTGQRATGRQRFLLEKEQEAKMKQYGAKTPEELETKLKQNLGGQTAGAKDALEGAKTQAEPALSKYAVDMLKANTELQGVVSKLAAIRRDYDKLDAGVKKIVDDNPMTTPMLKAADSLVAAGKDFLKVPAQIQTVMDQLLQRLGLPTASSGTSSPFAEPEWSPTTPGGRKQTAVNRVAEMFFPKENDTEGREKLTEQLLPGPKGAWGTRGKTGSYGRALGNVQAGTERLLSMGGDGPQLAARAVSQLILDVGKARGDANVSERHNLALEPLTALLERIHEAIREQKSTDAGSNSSKL